MKNPSMAKLTKAAGDSRTAMKMKKEAAAKMKKESAMKKAHADKESMAKLMDKASAMKMKEKSPVKKDNDEGTTTVKGITRDKDGKIISYSGEAAVNRMAKLEMSSNPGMTMEEAMKVAREQMAKSKSATKMGHKSPAKQKMNMVKGPDGKMVPDFAVDGKGANDMKSATKMKPGKATGKAVRQKKREARQEERKGKKIVRKLKKGLKKGEKSMKGKTPGTGMIFNEKVKEDLKKLPKAAVPMKVKKKIAQ